MTKEERKERLAQIQRGNPVATGFRLPFKGETKEFDVYEIPLDLLLYNPYNGRIGSAVKSYEKQDHLLNAENPDDEAIIEKLLWESKVSANQNTVESLKRDGQLRVGIVTEDGIIIDGNRRASLMNRIRRDPNTTSEQKLRCSNFRAVILPPADKKAILSLETKYQLGEDAKVDYNPIEKYLKCKQLKDAEILPNNIADLMGIKKSDVEEYLRILEVMDDYLQYNGYDSIYGLAAGHEDTFQKFSPSLKQYEGGSVSTMWEFNNADVNDLKMVVFDYIRLGLPQDDLRNIFLKPSKTRSSIFGVKNVWQRFLEQHNENINSVKELSADEYREQSSITDITKCLKARDAEWREKIEQSMRDNYSTNLDRINSVQQASKPLILLQKALDAINSIDPNSEAFITHEAEINHLIQDIISKVRNLKGDEPELSAL